MAGDRRPADVRFDEKVNRTETCWLWMGARVPRGYGYFRDGRRVYVHRWAWERENGPIPEDSWVLHCCDNPPCVNPEHLFLGNCQTNHDDMVAKNRSTRGERNPNAKLTHTDVEMIRALRSQSFKLREIAALFGVSLSNISYVCRKTWR